MWSRSGILKIGLETGIFKNFLLDVMINFFKLI